MFPARSEVSRALRSESEGYPGLRPVKATNVAAKLHLLDHVDAQEMQPIAQRAGGQVGEQQA